MLVFNPGFSLGLGSTVNILVSEILPVRAKGLVSGIAGAVGGATMFLSMDLFPQLVSAFGKHGAFWFFAVFCLLGAIYVGLFVPETKGKTLEEIENRFTRR